VIFTIFYVFQVTGSTVIVHTCFFLFSLHSLACGPPHVSPFVYLRISKQSMATSNNNTWRVRGQREARDWDGAHGWPSGRGPGVPRRIRLLPTLAPSVISRAGASSAAPLVAPLVSYARCRRTPGGGVPQGGSRTSGGGAGCLAAAHQEESSHHRTQATFPAPPPPAVVRCSPWTVSRWLEVVKRADVWGHTCQRVEREQYGTCVYKYGLTAGPAAWKM
jgi:hypothetical protein